MGRILLIYILFHLLGYSSAYNAIKWRHVKVRRWYYSSKDDERAKVYAFLFSWYIVVVIYVNWFFKWLVSLKMRK